MFNRVLRAVFSAVLAAVSSPVFPAVLRAAFPSAFPAVFLAVLSSALPPAFGVVFSAVLRAVVSAVLRDVFDDVLDDVFDDAFRDVLGDVFADPFAGLVCDVAVTVEDRDLTDVLYGPLPDSEPDIVDILLRTETSELSASINAVVVPALHFRQFQHLLQVQQTWGVRNQTWGGERSIVGCRSSAPAGAAFLRSSQIPH